MTRKMVGGGDTF